jgi:hypothetical protein
MRRVLLALLLVAAAPARAAPAVRVLGHGSTAEADRDAALVEKGVLDALLGRAAPVVVEDAAERAQVALARKKAEEGRAAYAELDAPKAQAALAEAARLLVDHVDVTADPKEAAAVLAVLGSVLSQNGDETAARAAFRRALTLVPTYAPPPGSIPDADVKLFEKVKETIVAQEQGALRIESTGSAGLVYVDGVLRGATPVEVRDILPGAHHVVVKRTGIGRSVAVADITTKRPVLSVAQLRAAGAAQRALAALAAYKGAEPARLLEAATHLEGATEVFLVRVLDVGGGRLARIARVDRVAKVVVDVSDVPLLEGVDNGAVVSAVEALLAKRPLADGPAPAAPAIAAGPDPAVVAAQVAAQQEDEGDGGGPWLLVGAAAGGLAVAGAVGVLVAVVVLSQPEDTSGLSDAERRVVLGF